MARKTYTFVAAFVAAGALAIGAVAATTGPGSPAAMPHSHAAHAGHAEAIATLQGLTRSDLRALLGRQLGEHAALAMNATNLGVTGSPAFPAAAAALDRNSVAIAKSIEAVYGKQAAKTFLDGRFQWRDHIRFFVDYTVALAKGDKAGQDRAVRNLQTYTMRHGAFLAKATGLPAKTVQNDLLAHVLQLKGQLDAYHAKRYGRAVQLYRGAYAHMFGTADALATAIAKQKGLPG
ncbi:MAG: hypothetical protein KatS3mg012_1838 [Gaiellaceae bacterium]|jgi:hypothetical protein|nr:MAG: hypothetical protein KatS3mg012_1838 [Gaiellaceae bacterium]